MTLKKEELAALNAKAAALEELIALKKMEAKLLQTTLENSFLLERAGPRWNYREAARLLRRHEDADGELIDLKSQRYRIGLKLGEHPDVLGAYSELRGLLDHDHFFKTDLQEVIEKTLARKKELGDELVAYVCDLSVGQVRVLGELKKIFGPQVKTYGTALERQAPTNPQVMQQHKIYLGSNLDPTSEFRKAKQKFDLMFSRKGAHYRELKDFHGAILSKLAVGGMAFIEFKKEYGPVFAERLASKIRDNTRGRFSAELKYGEEPTHKGMRKIPFLHVTRLK